MCSRWGLGLLIASCSPGWDLPREEHAPISVTVEPFGLPEQAPEVLRLRLGGVLGRAGLAELRLFQGELSDYHLGRLRAGDLPKTLLEREIPLVVWPEAPELVAAPAAVLTAGRHSLATPELGLIAAFEVVPTGRPLLQRFWPPRESSTGNGFMLFAGDARALGSEPLTLAPAGLAARLAPGLDEQASFAERCLRILTDASAAAPEGALALPPLLAGDALLEPAPLVLRSHAAAAPACDATEIVLGPACGSIEDDRVILRAPATAALFALESPERKLGVVEPGASLAVRGLVPGAESRIAGYAFDSAGGSFPLDVRVRARPPRDHLVLNEVLANPVGAEATSEWIELVNDGARAVDLSGYALVDPGGSFPLPNETLEPGELALLVGPGFAPDPELDIAVPEGVRRFALTALGKSGLANGGELLRLVDPEGHVVSRWPAVAAPAPGQSLARRSPDAADHEPSSFGPHGAPGASPGAQNALSSH